MINRARIFHLAVLETKLIGLNSSLDTPRSSRTLSSVQHLQHPALELLRRFRQLMDDCGVWINTCALGSRGH